MLLSSGIAVAWVAKHADVWEAAAAVLVFVVFVSAGSAFGRWVHVPVLTTLLRWSHRLRRLYYFNPPGSLPELLLRSVTATITAPFRSRDRAEVRMYRQLGAVFTVGFLLLDFGEELACLLTGGGWPSILDLLVMPTHALPRGLSALVAATLLLGLLVV